nr:MAG TPA: tail protein [Caudoviricetes sp.]
MLKLISDVSAVLNVDDFYICEKSNGLDELIFNMSIYDDNYPHVLEEAVIEYEQPYLVKAIDAGASTAKVKCQLNLDALKSEMKLGYSNNSATLQQTVDGVLPSGWLFVDNSGSTISRTIEGNYTPLEVIQQCVDTYGVVFRFDVSAKIVRAYTLSAFQPLGAFASRELNLTEINFKGKSTDFFTRLYAYGKDGLSFADINDGKPYVEYHGYTDKVICAYWQDERYTIKDNLLAAAQAAVKTGGSPDRSYECTVYDLAATNPEMYSWQDFSLFSVVRLIDDIKNIALDYQVVEYWRYPNYPEKNVVTLSSTAPKIQTTVKNIKAEIENPNSSFRQNMQALIDNMAASIAGYDGGNMLITQNTDGKPNGIKIMDTEDEATAQKILWLNLNGITYSHNGANGPYDTVWSFEQNGFVADWIVAGTMLANVIKGGTLTLGGSGNGNGVCQVLDASGNEIATLNSSGVNIKKGSMIINASGTGQKAVEIMYDTNHTEYINNKTRMFMEQDGFIARYSGTYGVIQTKVDGVGIRLRTLGGTIDSPDYSQGTEVMSANIVSGEKSYVAIRGTLSITGDLTVTGQKNRSVWTESYGRRLINAYETATPYFGDIGTTTIGADGTAQVEIDPIFAETVSLDDYVVFLQAEGPGEAYISKKDSAFFEISGTPGLAVAYEIKAKQKGFENVRLEEYHETVLPDRG